VLEKEEPLSKGSKVKSHGVKVYSTPAGVIVSGATATEVRKAMKLLSKPRRSAVDSRMKAALKLYETTERFFKLGGRYKKPFTRRKKAKK
jgi:hypothetical protein